MTFRLFNLTVHHNRKLLKSVLWFVLLSFEILQFYHKNRTQNNRIRVICSNLLIRSGKTEFKDTDLFQWTFFLFHDYAWRKDLIRIGVNWCTSLPYMKIPNPPLNISEFLTGAPPFFRRQGAKRKGCETNPYLDKFYHKTAMNMKEVGSRGSMRVPDAPSDSPVASW